MEPRIFWAGDSTVAQNNYTTYPQSGIGQGLRLFIKKEVEIKNHAINGRSTKSFIDEFRLAPIYDEITEGDFLFIQFGHNDEKIEDPARYTDPYGEYRVNLEKYINVAKNKGAYPVLITSLYRRKFLEDGTLSQTEHKEYQQSMKDTAKECHVPCIDLYTASKVLLERTPKEISERWFMNLQPGEYQNFPEGNVDNTHLHWNGAMIFSRIVALGLKALGEKYADLLIEPEKLTGEFEGEIIHE